MNNMEIKFNLNGQNVEYKGKTTTRLLDVLRKEFKLTGTKSGCKEGECGACSVIMDGKLINSCLVAMGRVEGADILTIEGYKDTERFALLDTAYGDVNAVQCGFCTPGMILASEALLSTNPRPSEEEIREGISGNLCRCTGYNAIVSAIDSASKEGPWGNPSPVKSVAVSTSSESTSEVSTSEESTSAESTSAGRSESGTGNNLPHSLKEALTARKGNLQPYAGGTDLMVWPDDNANYLFLHKVPEMRQIIEDEKYIRFGAACTFTEIIEHPKTPKILKDACLQIGAPAIRNAGTIGGNIGNGSAKADSALIFMVTDSELRLANQDSERIIPIKEFYSTNDGSKKLALSPNELIVEILMPKKGLDNYYHVKVGARSALSIARISFAGIMDINNCVIKNCATVFGAVSDVILRFNHIDQMLIGKSIEEARQLKEAYISAMDQAIIPIRGRVGTEYRKDVCLNLLRDFLDRNGI